MQADPAITPFNTLSFLNRIFSSFSSSQLHLLQVIFHRTTLPSDVDFLYYTPATSTKSM
jgi:hypothetical protein